MWSLLLWTLLAVLVLSSQMYLIISRFLRVLLYTYFRKVSVCGINNLPREGPVLLCPNHPNMLVDGILVITECINNGRQPYIWAKAALFRNKTVGWILRKLGAVPVFRPRHDVDMTPEQLEAASKEMFQKTWDVLAAGNVMLLFPEGTSYTAPKMLKLRTGVVRVATGFVKNYEQSVPIIPVGLTYFRKDSFRSQVVIEFGTPLVITPEDVSTAAFQEDEKREVKKITDRLEEKMHAVTLNASEFSTLRVARVMRRLYLNTAASIDANKDIQLTQQIIHMLEQGMDKEGEKKENGEEEEEGERRRVMLETRANVERYKDALDTLRVKDQDIVLSVPRNSLLQLFLERVLYLLVLVPLGTPGLILNFPYYLLANKLNTLAGFAESKSMFKIIAAAVAVPIQWIFFIFIAWLLGGTSYAYVVSISLPLLLYSHIRVMEESRSLLENVRFLFNITAHRDQMETIRKERTVLAAQVNALVTTYIDPEFLKTIRKAVVASENSPGHTNLPPSLRFRGMSTTDSFLQ